jgi:hypothetical protein
MRPWRWPSAPRIHNRSALHRWTEGPDPDPDDPFHRDATMDCARCGQHVTVLRSELANSILNIHTCGCAGRRFTGRYRRGDYCEADNTSYLFVRYMSGGRAVLRELGYPRRLRVRALADLQPVLAGREEAEKRRLASLGRGRTVHDA